MEPKPIKATGQIIVSPENGLIKSDWVAAGKRALIFLAPYLLVLIPVVIEQMPKEWVYSATALFILNRLTDLLRRFMTETRYKV